MTVQLIAMSKDRHPSTASIAKFLVANPNLPNGTVSNIAVGFQSMAETLLQVIDHDSPELTAGLRKLLEAKDCFVRAALDEQPGFWTDR